MAGPGSQVRPPIGPGAAEGRPEDERAGQAGVLVVSTSRDMAQLLLAAALLDWTELNQALPASSLASQVPQALNPKPSASQVPQALNPLPILVPQTLKALNPLPALLP